MTRSQWARIVKPRPTATPFTAASSGLGNDWTMSRRTGNPEAPSASAVPDAKARISLRSCPAEKAVPVPVRTTARTLLSSRAPARASAAARYMATSNALRASGRSKVTMRTWPRSSARMRSASGIERTLAHLLPDRDDRRIGQRAALPVGAVDDEGVAGDEAGVGRGEERRRPPQLLTLADAHRRLADVLVMGPGQVALDVCGHVLVGEEPRHQAVDLDAVGRPLDGERFGEVLDAGLGCRRVGEAGAAGPGVRRPHVDDRAWLIGRQVPAGELAAAQERAVEGDVDDGAPGVRRHVLGRHRE